MTGAGSGGQLGPPSRRHTPTSMSPLRWCIGFPLLMSGAMPCPGISEMPSGPKLSTSSDAE
jgi:hypothetical protein